MALLESRISAGDTVLKDHFVNAPKNAMYISPDIQNQVIEVLGDHIRGKILRRVQKAQCFTIIADEVTDCSNKEQLCLAIRYVNPDNYTIHEDLVTFIECDDGITGQAVAEKILNFLKRHLDPSKLRGQAYDGAGNMSGKTKGAAARISSEFPLAHYSHCASHCLNLAIVNSFDEVNIRNMIGIVNRVSIYFSAHPKRQRKLEESIEKTQLESNIHKLKDLCRTRWIERIDALNRFQNLYPSIVACMESIKLEGGGKWSSDSITDASTLLLAITTTGFVCALVVTVKCLQYLLGLTRSLQAEAKDIVAAVGEVNNVIMTFKDVRRNIDMYHREWFDEVEKMCEDVGTEATMPRLCARQVYRSSTPATNSCEYYRRVISVPLLDHLLVELEKRFTPHQKVALLGLYLVPSLLVTKDLDFIVSSSLEFGTIYSSDLPQYDCLRSEIHSWYVKWKDQEKNQGI